jgi:serine/threonine protein phosphatase PrpC
MSLNETKNEIISVSYTYAGGSHAGQVRERNEDVFVMSPTLGLFLVVDGMGGHECGDIAAQTAAKTIQTSISRIEDIPEIKLRDAIILANNAVTETAVNRSVRMGAVLTGMLIDENIATVGHVGDTRLYKIRNETIDKLTTDHSIVGDLENDGLLSEQRLMRHPRRSEVIRCLGLEAKEFDGEDFVDIFQVSFEPDSAFLLCSDGLTDLVMTSRILEIIKENAGSPKAVVEQLIAEANELGGCDNITVIFISGRDFALEVSERIYSPARKSKNGGLFSRFFGRLAWIVLGIIAGFAAAYFLLTKYHDLLSR